MKKAYYLFNPGRMSRRDNTLKFVPTIDSQDSDPTVSKKPRYLPIENISALYIFGSVDANSAMYNYLGQKQIPVHFFDYYKHYTGSFSPKEYLLAGKMLVAQSKAYLSSRKRMKIATQFVESASYNILKNLKYYKNRHKKVQGQIDHITYMRADISRSEDIDTLMGIEGNCRQVYYSAFDNIIEGYAWEGRKKRPPKNELNALVSFGNSVCYTLCLDAIYNSQLNPTISYLHEPGYRRYSLALDISEIFKPILVDRLIFKLCNRKEIRDEHFDMIDDGCFLSESGRKVYIRAWEDKLKQTIMHRKLGRSVSYRHLVRLECYKIAKYLIGIDKEYESFKIWW